MRGVFAGKKDKDQVEGLLAFENIIADGHFSLMRGFFAGNSLNALG